jgi:hypothetical protein
LKLEYDEPLSKPAFKFNLRRYNKAEGVDVKLRFKEKKLIDFRGKLYLAPLTTVGWYKPKPVLTAPQLSP